jgi:hypothetical protein
LERIEGEKRRGKKERGEEKRKRKRVADGRPKEGEVVVSTRGGHVPEYLPHAKT